jgi:hypothetical protein
VFSRNIQDGRVFKFRMAELHFDAAQIRSGFE